MRRFATIALLALAATACSPSPTDEQVGFHQYTDSASCSFKDFRRLSLTEASTTPGAAPDKLATWIDAVRPSKTGPASELSITFQRGDTAPATIIVGARYVSDKQVPAGSIVRATLTVDGAPAPAPLKQRKSATPTDYPELLAPVNDAWFARLFTAREATVRLFDKAGKLRGTYHWDVTHLKDALAALNRADWTCKRP